VRRGSAAGPIAAAQLTAMRASHEGEGLPNIFSGLRLSHDSDHEDGFNRKVSMAELLADFKHAKQERALIAGHRQQEEDSMRRRRAIEMPTGAVVSALPTKLSTAYPISLPRMQPKVGKQAGVGQRPMPDLVLQAAAATERLAPTEGAALSESRCDRFAGHASIAASAHAPQPPAQSHSQGASNTYRPKPPLQGSKRSKAPVRRCAGILAMGSGAAKESSGQGISFDTVIPGHE